jgi:hypothetical protein
VTTTLAAELLCPGGDAGAASCKPPSDEPAFTQATDDALDGYLHDHPPPNGDLGALLAAAAADAGVKAAFDASFAANGWPALDVAAAVAASRAKGPPHVTGAAAAGNASGGGGSEVPANVPAGDYAVAVESCAPSVGCSAAPEKTVTLTHPREEMAQLVASLSSACAQANASSQGATCTTRYSGFDGERVVATLDVTSCADGTCASARTTVTFRKR